MWSLGFVKATLFSRDYELRFLCVCGIYIYDDKYIIYIHVYIAK